MHIAMTRKDITNSAGFAPRCCTELHQLLEGAGRSLCRSNQGNSLIKCRPPEQACSVDPTNPELGTPHAQGHTIGDNGH